MKFGDINGPQRMNPTYFCDPLTLYVAPSSGQTFNVSSTLVYNHTPAKLMTRKHADVSLRELLAWL